MAKDLHFSADSFGMLYNAVGDSTITDRVLIQFTKDEDGCRISLGTLGIGIQITADADALYSYLTRIL